MLLLKSLRGAITLWLVIFGGGGAGRSRGSMCFFWNYFFFFLWPCWGWRTGKFIALVCLSHSTHALPSWWTFFFFFPHGEHYIDTDYNDLDLRAQRSAIESIFPFSHNVCFLLTEGNLLEAYCCWENEANFSLILVYEMVAWGSCRTFKQKIKSHLPFWGTCKMTWLFSNWWLQDFLCVCL